MRTPEEIIGEFTPEMVAQDKRHLTVGLAVIGLDIFPVIECLSRTNPNPGLVEKAAALSTLVALAYGSARLAVGGINLANYWARSRELHRQANQSK